MISSILLKMTGIADNTNMVFLLSSENPAKWKSYSSFQNAISEFTVHRVKIGANITIENDCYFEDAVTIGDSVIIGDKTIIKNHTAVFDGVILGSGVKIGCHCLIQENVVIGNRSEIGDGSFIGKGTKIAENVFLPPRTVAVNREKIGASETVTAIFSFKDRLQSFFGSDLIHARDSTLDPEDFDGLQKFADFLKDYKFELQSEALNRKNKQKEISALDAVLRKIIEKA